MIFNILFTWFVLGLVIEIYIMGCHLDGEFINPWTLYEETYMNWFGCWFCFILISVINPIFFVCKLLYIIILLIIGFIHYIFTVGRDD